MNEPSKEVRKLLDELGIKWWEGDDERKTLWESNGLTWEYFNDDNGDAWLGFLGACEQDITPEQAIAATVERGTCHDVYPNATYCFTCSECGHVRRFIQGWNNVTDSSQDELNFCPNCGRKIKEEAE